MNCNDIGLKFISLAGRVYVVPKCLLSFFFLFSLSCERSKRVVNVRKKYRIYCFIECM